MGGDRDGFQGNKRKKMDFYFIYCVFWCRYRLSTSSSGILSVTLVESGWAGEGPDSGCPRGREGGGDLCLEIILSTQTAEINKVTEIILVYLVYLHCNCIVLTVI